MGKGCDYSYSSLRLTLEAYEEGRGTRLSYGRYGVPRARPSYAYLLLLASLSACYNPVWYMGS